MANTTMMMAGKGVEITGKLLSSFFDAIIGQSDKRLSRKEARKRIKDMKLDERARKASRIVGTTTMKKMQLTGKPAFLFSAKLSEEQAVKLAQKAEKFGFMVVLCENTDLNKDKIIGQINTKKAELKKLQAAKELSEEEQEKCKNLESEIKELETKLPKTTYYATVLKEDSHKAQMALKEILIEEQYSKCVEELAKLDNKIQECNEKLEANPDDLETQAELKKLQAQREVVVTTMRQIEEGEINQINDNTVEDMLGEDILSSNNEEPLKECDSFEQAVNRLVDRDFATGETSFVISAKNPKNYIAVTPTNTYIYEGRKHTESEYAVYVDGKLVGEYNDNHNGKDKYFWANLRSQMKKMIGLDKNDRVLVTKSKEQLDKLILDYQIEEDSTPKYNNYADLIESYQKEAVASEQRIEMLGYKVVDDELVQGDYSEGDLTDITKMRVGTKEFDLARIELSYRNANIKLERMVKDYSATKIELAKLDNMAPDAMSDTDKANRANLELKRQALNNNIKDYKERCSELKRAKAMVNISNEKEINVNKILDDIEKKYSLDEVQEFTKSNAFKLKNGISAFEKGLNKAEDVVTKAPEFDLE